MMHENLYLLKQAPLKDLHNNKGQIQGVPKNPRIMKNDKFEALKKSISEFPDMLNLREIVCYDNGGELVVVGGNMRLAALKELGFDSVAVKILPAETPPEVLRRFVITDNSPYGEWDWDALANEWDTKELSDWGGGGWMDCKNGLDEEISDTGKDAPEVKSLKIGEFNVPLSDTEYDALYSQLITYIGENVIPDGFFSSVLDIENDATRGFFFEGAIDKIKGAGYNPRKISDEAMEDLKTSIKYIGVCRPIIVNRRNKTIIAGHQRVKAMIELGIKRGPVFYIEFINNENEVRINQIHNAIEDTGEGINVSVGISEKLGFVMTREINAVPQNTVKVMNYVYIIGRYGNIDSAVALQDGTVIKGADYLLACKMTHIPARVFYIENDKKDRARCLLFKDYGQFCYDGKRNDSYQQNLAQMNRLVGARRANYSQTYAMALRGGLLKDKRTLDFGAGKCAFAEKLANKGYDITPIEFFRISPGGGIAADWANAQIDLIACTIKNKGLYDVVICDSVLNSVISEEAETDVINCCAVFLKENGRLFISGRLLTNYKRDGWHKTIYQLDDKWFTMNMRHGEWYAQHFHKKETVKPLLEKHGLVVLEIEFDTNAWRAVCGKGKINLENCLRSIDNEFNIKYNKTQSYKKGDIMREALLRAYS